jgi:hypothetical protein
MRHSGLATTVLGVLLLATAPTRAEPTEVTAGEHDALALAGRIDRLIAARWQAVQARPAARSDDAEFVRRVYLDLNGRIPDILEARDFLDNPDPDKRGLLVRRLLEGERYAAHFTNVWRAVLVPQAQDARFGLARSGLDGWLYARLQDNGGYDRMVRDLVAGRDQASFLFYQANENKPENLAAATSRLFLGVKLECAQCHNHPFARWTRKQFWEYAAFFTALAPQRRSGAAGQRAIAIPGTGKTVEARFPDGTEPRWQPGVDARVTLAEWLTAPDNPYFARAAVNRVWEYFFGTGLVEPVDEMGPDHPPSHPELLDELARQFAAHRFDLKFLARAITTSNTYQLSSRATSPGPGDPRLFARMQVRGLSPEQLFDSLALATGYPEETLSLARPGQRRDLPARAEFLGRFPNQDKRTEAQTSILQALYLMNGKLVADATSPEHNKNLAIIGEADSVPTARRVEQLYLITLSRKPRPAESARLVRYVDGGGPSADKRKALADVFWALLNSGEFSANH